MAYLKVKIQPMTSTKKVRIEIDADKFERLAADFGLYNPGFLDSLDRAENDYKAGKVLKIKSLKQLRPIKA